MNSSVEISEHIEQKTILQTAFDAQRKAYLAAPVPDFAQRKQDLLALKRMINENRDAIVGHLRGLRQSFVPRKLVRRDHHGHRRHKWHHQENERLDEGPASPR